MDFFQGYQIDILCLYWAPFLKQRGPIELLNVFDDSGPVCGGRRRLGHGASQLQFPMVWTDFSPLLPEMWAESNSVDGLVSKNELLTTKEAFTHRQNIL